MDPNPLLGGGQAVCYYRLTEAGGRYTEQSQLLGIFPQCSEKHLESINITGCLNFIQIGVAFH